MIVRFDLERDDITAADIDNARVLAGALHYQLAASGQLLQMQARTLVRAMLAPHYAEDAQLRVRRLASEDRHDLVILGRDQLVLSDDVGGDGAHLEATARAETSDWNTTR